MHTNIFLLLDLQKYKTFFILQIKRIISIIIIIFATVTFPKNGCLPDILYSISQLVYIRPSTQLFLFTDSLIQFTVPPFARTFLSGNLRCNHSNV